MLAPSLRTMRRRSLTNSLQDVAQREVMYTCYIYVVTGKLNKYYDNWKGIEEWIVDNGQNPNMQEKKKHVGKPSEINLISKDFYRALHMDTVNDEFVWAVKASKTRHQRTKQSQAHSSRLASLRKGDEFARRWTCIQLQGENRIGFTTKNMTWSFCKWVLFRSSEGYI